MKSGRGSGASGGFSGMSTLTLRSGRAERCVRVGPFRIDNRGADPDDAAAMPKRSSIHKRPTDLNELAKAIANEATREPDAPGDEERPVSGEKNPAAVHLGRLGGLKGGKARAIRLTEEKRSEIARKAALARWQKRPPTDQEPPTDG